MKRNTNKKLRIKERLTGSSFYRAFQLIKKNLHLCLYTVMLDFIFLALILLTGRYFGSLIPGTERLMEVFKTHTNLMLFAFGYPLLYYLFILLLYSLTKLSILNLLGQLSENRLDEKSEGLDELQKKEKLSMKGFMKGFWRFFLLNIFLFVIFLFIALIGAGIPALLLRNEFLKYAVLFLSVPFFFFAYSITNIAHTLFIKNQRKNQRNKVLMVIKNSFSLAFSRIRGYASFAVWDTGLIIIYLIVYNIIHLLFRFTLFLSREMLESYGPIYLKVFSTASLIFIYFIIAFNRVYFYERLAKES